MEMDIHVLTVDPNNASYLSTDKSLLDDVSDKITIHTTSSFEPINWYAKFVGKDKVPTAGFSNVNTQSHRNKIINFFRSHLFIPDPRRGWNFFAKKAAIRIIDKYGIKTIITSTPPHSGQLIGLYLKQHRSLEWIADLRDPWTDIYYYPVLQHSRLSKKIDSYYELKVLQQADKILTVSEPLKNLFLAKSANIEPEKIMVLPNGFDAEDFNTIKRQADDLFDIVYTGTMSDQYNPDSFLLALADFIHNNDVQNIRFSITGRVSERIQNKIKAMKLHEYFAYQSTVPHNQINQIQKNADLLLLLIPEVPHAQSISTGKIYEYLATGVPVLCLGPTNGDASKLLSDCRAGMVFEREDFQGIKQFIIQEYLKFREGRQNLDPSPNVKQYDRTVQAKKIYNWLFNN